MGRTACTEPQCLYRGDLYLYLHVAVCWNLSSGFVCENLEGGVISDVHSLVRFHSSVVFVAVLFQFLLFLRYIYCNYFQARNIYCSVHKYFWLQKGSSLNIRRATG